MSEPRAVRRHHGAVPNTWFPGVPPGDRRWFQHMRFRPVEAPAALPFSARSSGRGRVPAGGGTDHPEGRPMWCVFWSQSGGVHATIAGHELRLHGEGVLLVGPDVPHRLRADADGWEYRWLTIDGALAQSALAPLVDAPVQAAGPCPHALFDRLDAIVARATPAALREASAIAYDLFLRATRPAGADRGDPLLERALALLEARLGEPLLTIAQIARAVGLSVPRFSRRFHRLAGLTASAWLAERRLERAAYLLGNTALPIAEVGARCGFADPAYFARAFHRRHGVPPRAWRQGARA